MFNGKVLVATDGSPLSERAVETAAELAQKVGAVLTAVTVVEPYPYSGVGESSAVAGSDYQAKVGAEASARLARVKELADKSGLDCRTSMQEDSEVYRGILTAARQTDAGLIVMASMGGRGEASIVMAPCPVRLTSTL